MNNPTNKKITLIVNDCLIKLHNGSVLNVSSYRADRLGIYFLSQNTAKIFAISEGVKDTDQKLCYVPYEAIEVILYDVAKSDTESDTEDLTTEPEEPQG